MKTITEKANNAAKSASMDFGYLEATLSDGSPIKIGKDALQNLIRQEVDARSMQDNVFVMFHRKSDNNPLMVKPAQWPAQEKAGEIAEGVVIFEGGRHLVIATTDSPQTLMWSTAVVAGGGFTSTDRLAVLNDWTGKASTAKQFAHAECKPATTAVGYCATYAKTNANGQGLTAGKWWLPSAGEMLMIYANLGKINYALSMINGANPINASTWYWTSSEHSSAYAWVVFLSDGYVGLWNEKAKIRGSVRAVSAFIV